MSGQTSQADTYAIPENRWRKSIGLRVRLRRHRCESRSVWCSPPIGWVTMLAGLLAHGSMLVSGLPSFPVAVWTQARRSQLRGQPRIAGEPAFVFPLSSSARTEEPTYRGGVFRFEGRASSGVCHGWWSLKLGCWRYPQAMVNI